MGIEDKTKKELLKELKELQTKHCLLQDSYQKEIIENKISNSDFEENSNLSFENSIHRNYNECEKTETAFIESEEKFKVLSDYSIQGILLIQDEKVSYTNTSFQNITGLTFEETQNLKFEEYIALIHPDDRAKALDIKKKLQKGIPIDELNILRIKHKNDNYRWVHSTTKSMNINNKTALLSMIIDITAQKKMEDELTQNRKKIKILVANSEEIIYEIDANGIFTLLKGKGLKRIGLKPGQVVGMSVFELYKDYPNVIDGVNKALNGKTITREVQIGINYFRSRNIPQLNLKGEVVGLIGLAINITDRAPVEEELRTQKKKLADIIEGTNAGTWDWNIKTGEVELNERWAEIIGYTLKELEPIDINTWINNVFPDDLPFANSELEKNFKKEINYFDVEFRQPHKNGSLIWVNARGKIVEWNDNGEPLRMSGTHLDITLRKQAKLELIKAKERAEESEKQLKLISNNFVNGMIYQVMMLDENRRKFTYVSDAVTKLYGCTPNEAKENPNLIYSKIYEEDVACLIQKEKEALINMSVFKTEARVINPDGSLRWSYYVSKPRKINDLICWDGIEVDVTERKKVEEELIKSKEKIEDSEKRFKALHNASFGGIAIHDKGIILDCNFGLSKMSGFTSNELIGMNGLLLIDEGSRGIVMKNILANFEDPYEAIGVRKNKETYPIRLEARCIPYKGKNVRVVEFRDISEQKRGEEELKVAKEKAEESDRLKSAFLANMSHEIRTPLNGILGFSELLVDSDFDSKKKEEMAKLILDNGDLLLTIINDVLDISKIEAGQIELHPTRFSIENLIIDIRDLFLAKSMKMGLELQIDYTPEIFELELTSDFIRIKQIITNLVSNAFKYTEEGFVELGCTATGDEVIFRVKDTGVGIPKSKQAQIFERFNRQEALTKKIGGNGLGLAIAKSFVEMLGGEIWVESEVGKGSTFYFTLPINQHNL